MKWQVGSLRDYKIDDPEFDDKFAAFDNAMVLSEDFDDEFGIWTSQDDGGELIAIAHNGELFRRDFFDFDIEITLPPMIVNPYGTPNSMTLVNPDGSIGVVVSNVGTEGGEP